MTIDFFDIILVVGFATIVLVVIARRRAGVGLNGTAKSALGQRSQLYETIAKCVIVVFGITLMVAMIQLLHRRR